MELVRSGRRMGTSPQSSTPTRGTPQSSAPCGCGGRASTESSYDHADSRPSPHCLRPPLVPPLARARRIRRVLGRHHRDARPGLECAVMSYADLMARRDLLRDTEGRDYLAVEWSGNPSGLTDDELHHRIDELEAHIGRVSTEYLPVTREWRERPGWHELAAPAVAARLAALRARG